MPASETEKRPRILRRCAPLDDSALGGAREYPILCCRQIAGDAFPIVMRLTLVPSGPLLDRNRPEFGRLA